MGLIYTSTGEPAVEPVSVAEAKTHMRVVGTDDDTDIAVYEKAARRYIENRQRRAHITQQWQLTMDHFPPGEIELPRNPVQAVDSIVYTDQGGTTGNTWASTSYDVDTSAIVARIRPAFSESYPSTRAGIDAVTITFTAGYGDGSSDVPNTITAAVRILTAHLYESREPIITGSIVAKLPFTLDTLIDIDRIPD